MSQITELFQGFPGEREMGAGGDGNAVWRCLCSLGSMIARESVRGRGTRFG